jgi:hypothetical protein
MIGDWLLIINLYIMFCCKEQVNKKEVVKWGIFGGLAELAYIVLIGLLINYTGDNLGQKDLPVLGFITFLLLFVFSAGISGLFVFGYPIYLATQKRISDAIMTALISLGALLAGFFLAFILLNVL